MYKKNYLRYITLKKSKMRNNIQKLLSFIILFILSLFYYNISTAQTEKYRIYVEGNGTPSNFPLCLPNHIVTLTNYYGGVSKVNGCNGGLIETIYSEYDNWVEGPVTYNYYSDNRDIYLELKFGSTLICTAGGEESEGWMKTRINVNSLSFGSLYSATTSNNSAPYSCAGIVKTNYDGYIIYGISPPRPDGIKNDNNFITHLVEKNEVSLRPYLSNGEIDFTSNTYGFEIQYSTTGNEDSWITISNPANFVVPDYSTLPETYGKGRKLYLRARIYRNDLDNPVVKYSPYFTLPVEVRPRLLNYKYSDTSYCNENESFAHFTVGALGQNDKIFLKTSIEGDNGQLEDIPLDTINSTNSNNNDYKVRIPITYETIHVKHKIIDANGDSQEFATYDIKLNNPHNNPTLTLNVINFTDSLNCFGDSNGQIILTASGGATTDYTYHCGSSSNKTGEFYGLEAGKYVVYVVDSRTCESDKQTITIDQPAPLSLNISPTHVTCHGASNGTVKVEGSGGTPTYTYKIDNGAEQTSGTFTGLVAGLHTVTIRDSNGCTFNMSVTITQPGSAVSGRIESQTNLSCYGGSNGSVTVAGSGGISPYTYKIDNGAEQSSGMFTGLVAGLHTVTIRDSNGCTFNKPVTITQPESAVSGRIESQTNVSCYGGSNGSVTVEGSGGTPPYTFTKDGWSTTAGPTYNTYTFSGLSKGYYNLEAKDANGCTVALPQVNITSPSKLVVENITTTHNRCFSGSEGVISVKATGGTAPYRFTVDNGLSWGFDSVFSGLTAGSYYTQVRDSKDCITEPTLVNITQPADSFVLAVDTFKNVSCFGGNDGEVSVYVALGGHPPFTYSSDGVNWQPERVFNQLAAGTGYLYAADSSGCTVKVKNPITQPEPISATVTPYHVACKGASTGKLVLSIAGGVGSYQVTLLSNGKTVGSKVGITKTAEYTDLSAGTYELTITDSNGCIKEIYGIVIAEPANALHLLPFKVSQPTCFGYSNGKVDADAAGGWGGYRYTLLGAESSNGVFSGLKAGTYSMEVADSLGCKVQESFTLDEPDPLALDVKVADVRCFGGSDGRVEVTATGGTPQYSFAITGNEILPKGTNSELSIMENLTAGNYTIWLYDNNGCSTSKPITISQPPKLQVLQNNFNTGATDKTCTDTVLIAPTGGVTPYTLQFPDSAAIDCPVSGYLLHSLPNGRYPFRITDSHGCTVDDTASISNLPPPTLELVEVVNASCSYSADGSITVQAFSGTNWVEVKWNNGASGNQLVGVPAGRYTAVATDLYGCTHAETYEISKPDTLIVSQAMVHNPTCHGGTDAGISVIVTGGTKPYSYLWSNGVQADSTGHVPAGVYSVTVTDSNGCTTSGSYTLTDPPSMQPSLPSLVTLCTNQTYIADAGVMGTSYLWLSNNGFTATTAKVELSASGEYYLIVTDGNGCVGRDTIRIESYNGIIDADFLIADRASVNDTIVLIEMSWPIPQAIQWLYPAESFSEIYRTDYSLFLIPLKEGLFTIGLMTYSGPCNQYIEKKITIGPSKDLRNADSNLPLFKNIGAFPNPNNGQFELLVELNSQADIVVEIFTLYGKRILLKEFRGQSIYRIPSAINPIPGIYLIRITSGHHSESVRIVVQ